MQDERRHAASVVRVRGGDRYGHPLAGRRAEKRPLQRRLASSKRQHESLAAETKALLRAQGKEAKSADPAARAMSWMKTEAMLAMKPGDATTADLISTGCSMGIKSLARYCNQYPTASREAKDIAQSLIRLEDQLVKDMRPYL